MLIYIKKLSVSIQEAAKVWLLAAVVLVAVAAEWWHEADFAPVGAEVEHQAAIAKTLLTVVCAAHPDYSRCHEPSAQQ